MSEQQQSPREEIQASQPSQVSQPNQASNQPEKPKKDTVRKIFVERMNREGRGKEWFATVKAVMAETGAKYHAASYEAMARMGYEGPKREWEIHAKYVEEEQAKLKTPAEKLREEIREERRIQNFEEALASLPSNATLDEVTKWIDAHPAMSRKARSNNPLKDVVITAEDIYPQHGTAPSKSAVHALQYWANHPAEFYKSVYAPVKKGTDQGAGSGVTAKDVGIDEIERLLQELGNE